MKFKKTDLDHLLAELSDLPSEWLDDEGRHLVSEVPVVMQRIRAIGPTIDEIALTTLIREHPQALDVLRLIAGEGQETLAHRICDSLGGNRRGWSALRSSLEGSPRKLRPLSSRSIFRRSFRTRSRTPGRSMTS
jgi:hypothetical protein